MKKIIYTALMVAAMSTVSSAKEFTVNLGVASSSIESTSSVGANLELEVGLVKLMEDALKLRIQFGATTVEDGYLGYMGFGARYALSQALEVGILANPTMLSSTFDGQDSVNFIGFTYGADVKYHFNANHGVLLSYTTGSLSEEKSGLIDVSVDVAKLNYSYTF